MAIVTRIKRQISLFQLEFFFLKSNRQKCLNRDFDICQ